MRKKLVITTAILVVALCAGVAGAQIQQRFEDVPTDHYAYEAVNWATENGITQGCGDGTSFCPDRNLNRAEMVTFLKRYHDRFGTAAVALGEPVDASSGVTLTGTGSDVTGGLTVTDGRWRVEFTIERAGAIGFVGFKAFGEGPGRLYLVDGTVEANTIRKTFEFRVASFADFIPGKVQFEVFAEPDATWTITLGPL